MKELHCCLGFVLATETESLFLVRNKNINKLVAFIAITHGPFFSRMGLFVPEIKNSINDGNTSFRFRSIQECYADLRLEGKKIYTTHLGKDSTSLYDLKLFEPCALVFGNEHDGVSETASELSDGNFIIPQVGMIQSLNISVACAVSVYEAFRQRLNNGMYDKPQLNSEEMFNKMNEWSER